MPNFQESIERLRAANEAARLKSDALEEQTRLNQEKARALLASEQADLRIKELKENPRVQLLISHANSSEMTQLYRDIYDYYASDNGRGIRGFLKSINQLGFNFNITVISEVEIKVSIYFKLKEQMTTNKLNNMNHNVRTDQGCFNLRVAYSEELQTIQIGVTERTVISATGYDAWDQNSTQQQLFNSIAEFTEWFTQRELQRPRDLAVNSI